MTNLKQALVATAALLTLATAYAAPDPHMPQDFVLKQDLVYTQALDTTRLKLDIYRDKADDQAEPVVIWVPAEGVKDSNSKLPPGLTPKFPSPLASYLAYHYAVVSIDYHSQNSKQADILQAVAYLKAQAATYHLNTDNIAVVQATDTGYQADILAPATAVGNSMAIDAAKDQRYQHLQSPDSTRQLISFFNQQFGKPGFDTTIRPLAQRDPDVSWIDPITNAPDHTSYHLYPTPARGPNTYGSFLVLLPDDYVYSQERYPVIYYLHGGVGNQREGGWLASVMHQAMKAGTMPKAIIVFPQALPIGWYVNAHTGSEGVTSGPVEDVLIKDLVPYIDKNYRTIAKAEARGLEGWSMGGFGALRLAFKYPELFKHASSISGAVIDWEDEPMKQYLVNTFGTTSVNGTSPKAYFDSLHPRTMAAHNLAKIKNSTQIRLLVGDKDWLYDKQGKKITALFSEQLSKLGITNQYSVLANVDHMMPDYFAAHPGEYPIDFWVKAFQGINPGH